MSSNTPGSSNLSEERACRQSNNSEETYTRYASDLYAAKSCTRCRRSGKQKAVAYAAKDAQGGMAVTRPPWIEAFCTSATVKRQILLNAKENKIYLGRDQHSKISRIVYEELTASRGQLSLFGRRDTLDTRKTILQIP
jgi:hypothetical protein